MKTAKGFKLSALGASLLLAACGGGGSGGSGDTAALTSDVLASGPISEFGSVIVNGVRYETDGAQVVSADDGRVLVSSLTDSQLRRFLGLGQVIVVEGSSTADGTEALATRLILDNPLVGPVTAGSITASSLEILGQRVTLGPDSVIDDSLVEAVAGEDTLADDIPLSELSTLSVGGSPLGLSQLISAGMRLEVSGFATDSGIEATRIEDVDNRDRETGESESADTSEVEIKGRVASLDADTGTFRINNLEILFGLDDLDTEDFGTGMLAEGDLVEVKGRVLSDTQVDASEIEREEDFAFGRGVDDDSRIEVEGVIASIQPDAGGPGGLITINGLEVRVPNIGLFVAGTRVEIKGRLVEGELRPDRVEDEDSDRIRIEDDALSISDARVETRLGLSINISADTRVDDLGEGSRIRARGFSLGEDIIWTRLKFDDDLESDCRLRGPVEEVTGTNANDFGLVIAGVTIDLAGVEANGFRQEEDRVIARDSFFELVSPGDRVDAKSTSGGCTSGNLAAREVELQGPEDNSSPGRGGDEPEDRPASGDDDGSDDARDDDEATGDETTTEDGDAASDDDAQGDDDRLSNLREVTGSVARVSADELEVAGETLRVDDNTRIDDSFIEAARGTEIEGDRSLGSVPETLDELIARGTAIEVQLDASQTPPLALSIEDL